MGVPCNVGEKERVFMITTLQFQSPDLEASTGKVGMSPKNRSATNSTTYTKIAERLQRFSPAITLGDHIDWDRTLSSSKGSLVAYGNTLDGLDFVPKLNRNGKPALLESIEQARDSIGQPAFVIGSKHKKDTKHFAIRKSFGETKGMGAREIWRPRLSNRSLKWTSGRPGLNVPTLDAGFSAHFADNKNLPDMSSVHFSVSENLCNVHIDEMGFVMELVSGDLVVTPDAFRHWLIELIWKTKLRGKIPDWFVDHVNLVLPSTPNQFSRVGISFDLVKKETVKVSVTGSCGLSGGFNCSGTVNVTGTHDLLGSK